MNNITFVGEHARTYDVRWHTYNNWELVYCTSGGGSFRFENGTSIQYRECDVVCIPPLEIHANCSLEGFTNLHAEIRDPSFPGKQTRTEERGYREISIFKDGVVL